MRMGGSPLTLSDRCRFKSDAEAASSICSWAFVAEPDKNSLHVCYIIRVFFGACYCDRQV